MTASSRRSIRIVRAEVGAGWRIVRRGWRLIRALLGELSDERAYARHLAACGRAHSAEEWQRFSDERLRARFARAKCC